MKKNVVAISSDFLTAFVSLPRHVQGKVTEFINKFRNNPRSPGINYEKIHDAVDPKICSVRIDRAYRGIVVRQKENGVYLLLWVDHHDEAYDWARRKRCEVNPLTGNVQVFDIQEIETSEETSEITHGIFSEINDDDLLALGVPRAQINFVRKIASIEEFYKSKSNLPEDVYEGLEWVANGFPPEEVIDLISSEREKNFQENDLASALQNPGSQRSFVVVDGEEELRRIMAEPLEKWRVFLHPTQREIVNKTYSGPARVLGGAGTGKTVVAMHRAKCLAGQVRGKEKILFTTYTANLADDIKNNLRKICTVEEQKHIEVINLDAWVAHFLREQGYSYQIVYNNKLIEMWEEAIIISGEDTEFSASFFMEEWSMVVNAKEAYSKKQYMKASRIGRGTPLTRKKRIQVWQIFEEYLNIMKERQQRDVDYAMYECRKILENSIEKEYYPSVIIDEAQDLNMNAFRLIRELAGPEHSNDIFIVGDAHQRIYKKRVSMSKCGINIRGRSSYLKINYRTTEEIRKYAFSLLKGISFDDLDEGYDDGINCQSLTHGCLPNVKHFSSAGEEIDYLITKVKELVDSEVQPKDICIVARTHRLLDDYIRHFIDAGFRTFEIKRSKTDDRSYNGIRIATMHRVKGLEFQYVFVVAVNKRVVPLSLAINNLDPVVESEAIIAEKCLLYVSLTRAQKSAYLTSYGTQSEFLV